MTVLELLRAHTYVRGTSRFTAVVQRQPGHKRAIPFGASQRKAAKKIDEIY